MLPLEKLQAYLDTAAEQVRWKRARPALTQELRTHLLDQYDACTAAGLDEEAAATETLRQMGDAVEVGTALDRAHRPKPQWGLLGLTAVLAVVGLVMQFYVLPDTAYRGIQVYSFAGQLIGVLVGLACMLGIYFMDYTILGKRPWQLCFALMGVIYFCFYERVLPIMLPVLYGLELHAFYLTFFTPVIYALILYQLRTKGNQGFYMALCALLPLLLPACLLGHMAQISLLLLSGTILLLLAISKGWFGGSKGVQIICTIAVIFIFISALWTLNINDIQSRLLYDLSAESYKSGWGYYVAAVRGYLSEAALLGSGCPNSHNDVNIMEGCDFLLTWLIHRAGWLAGIAVILLLAALLIWGFLLCRKQQNMLGRLVGTSVLLVLSIQTLLYVSANFGFIVSFSLSFPLLSYGKAYQIVNLTLLGLLFSVFRGERLPSSAVSIHAKGRPSRVTYQDGILTVNLKKAPAPQK